GFVAGDSRPDYFHVAGTNGKGSVVCFLQHILAAHGRRVGACASPYVYDIRERVQFGLEPVPEADFARWTSRLRRQDEEFAAGDFGPLTAFEIKTALGFLCWQENRADSVALEVGMGGRLDATNVVAPRVCGVVSIGWDHMEILGDSLAKIAGEKGGILKPGVPTVLGRMDAGARKVLEARAAEVGAALWRIDHEVVVERDQDRFTCHTPVGSWGGLRPGMAAPIQVHNLALAVAMLAAGGVALDPDRLAKAAESARWPGRFEELSWNGLPVVLDGAHNLDSAGILRAALEARFRSGRLGLVVSQLRGHDPLQFLEPLVGLTDLVVVCPVPGPRGRDVQEIAEAVREAGMTPPIVVGNAQEALQACLDGGADQVCVTGSYYLLKPFKELITCGR
ncbi:MAG: hypothetical protein MH204_01915, partial [Fimbriimonadaceae bacterium]|nr:hypothetical protein [Fimbriimonadaceae bacterium]